MKMKINHIDTYIHIQYGANEQKEVLMLTSGRTDSPCPINYQKTAVSSSEST